jgi:hypothetical protein
VLVAIPSVVAARPVHDRGTSAATLLARVRASSGTPYSGLVESHGSLSLPTIPNTGDLAALLSGTSRLRAWWQGPHHWRVDQIDNGGEDDTIVNDATTVEWNYQHDKVISTVGEQPLRQPRAGDLLPPALAERLVPADLPARATRLPAVRIAGRAALGLRLTPDGNGTTIGHVDIDVDEGSGLPLRVAVTGRGQGSPSVSTTFLELSITRPAASSVEFVPPADASTSYTAAPDFLADADRYAPFALPDSLAGLPRTTRVSRLDPNGGAATYGRGYSLLAVLPLQRSTSSQVDNALQPPVGQQVDIGRPDATALAEQIPLVNVLVVSAGFRHYLLTGTVTMPVLVRAADQLVDSPPVFREPPRGGRP